jgi:hypothetical protein
MDLILRSLKDLGIRDGSIDFLGKNKDLLFQSYFSPFKIVHLRVGEEYLL